MSFAGHAIDALKRIQYNRSLLLMRRSRYSELKVAVSKIKSKYHKFHDRNTLSEKDLKAYKKKIKTSIQKKRQLVFIKSFTLTIFVGIIIAFLTKYLYILFTSSF